MYKFTATMTLEDAIPVVDDEGITIGELYKLGSEDIGNRLIHPTLLDESPVIPTEATTGICKYRYLQSTHHLLERLVNHIAEAFVATIECTCPQEQSRERR